MKRRLVLCLCLIGCLLAALPALAQEGPRGNQLLLIMEDQSALWDAARGEYEFLPAVDVAELTDSVQRWKWSPDGRYLLVTSYAVTPPEIRLYDVEAQAWDGRIFGKDAAWSPDGRSIAYVHDIEMGAELLLYDWDQETSTVLYSVRGEDIHAEGLSQPEWSPSGTSLFFIYYVWRFGGSTNYMHLLDLITNEVHELSGQWYASYNPIWSPDGSYFLVYPRATAPYVHLSIIVTDAGEGDIFLYDAHSGERQRITHTPLQAERNIRWSEDGQTILYDVTETRAVALADAFTLPQTAEDVTIPEAPQVQFDGAINVLAVSPDGALQAWSTRGCGLIVSDAEGNWVNDVTVERTETGCPQLEVIGWRPLPPS